MCDNVPLRRGWLLTQPMNYSPKGECELLNDYVVQYELSAVSRYELFGYAEYFGYLHHRLMEEIEEGRNPGGESIIREQSGAVCEGLGNGTGDD